MATRGRVVILGAGPAGLGAALQLSRRNMEVTVIERSKVVGGNAGSFDFAGMRADYGSHRLHPSCSPRILADIRRMLGDDLLERPRHGRIHLQGRWLHFPLQAWDLARNAPPALLAGFAADQLRKRQPGSAGESFASVLERGLGHTICREFYFPYARKIWGEDAASLDAEQARRRVAASSPAKLLRKVLSALPGVRRKAGNRFYYPRRGFGQISEAYCREAVTAGARLVLGASVERLEAGPGSVRVSARSDGEEQSFEADLALSTIPITQLARLFCPEAPPEVLAAASSLRYRAMILVYLALEADRFTEYDAHYFPSPEIAITRLSEPKHYGLAELKGRTILCAEMPCSPEDEAWKAADEELAQRVMTTLDRCGLPVRASVAGVAVRRAPQAYPIYLRGYRTQFDRIDAWLSGQPRVVSIGRQGLFAHDNTHHTLAMAYAAADCLDDRARLDSGRWAEHRAGFESFVVED